MSCFRLKQEIKTFFFMKQEINQSSLEIGEVLAARDMETLKRVLKLFG
jgi:hypothetical protein